MSMAYARSSYRQVDAHPARDIEDPYKVIQVTLAELERSLRVMAEAQKAGNGYPETHMNRAFTAIYILQTSLDFEKGADLATSLFQVYEFCRIQVLKAFRREVDSKLAEALEAIAGIHSAWSEIEPQVQAEGLSGS